jgi:hypothetical protein
LKTWSVESAQASEKNRASPVAILPAAVIAKAVHEEFIQGESLGQTKLLPESLDN